MLPYYLFDDREISKKEYEEIKKHSIYGANVLFDGYLFTSICVGLHHSMYHKGYGLTLKDIPEKIGISNLKKMLNVASIVSICDFIEAFTYRSTTLRSDSGLKSLKELLYEKYPNDIPIVDIALNEYPKIKYWQFDENGFIMKCEICGNKLSPTKGHIMVRNKDGYLVGYECWKCTDKKLEKLKRR